VTPAAPHTPPATRRVPTAEANLTTQTGKTLSFARLGGCGCGSRLKTFDPFRIITATVSKTDSP
jgi:hypothetical protein